MNQDDFKFDLQRHAVTLPDAPEAAEGTVGKDYLLYIAVINGGKESWALVGGQKSGTIDESADEVDVSTKTTGGYKAVLPGLTSWSIDFEALQLLPGRSDGVEALKIARAQKKLIKVKFRYPDNSYRVGWASSTSNSLDTPSDSAAVSKGKLNGNGPLSNESVFVTKTAAADQIFYFDKKSLITKVILDGTEVAEDEYDKSVEGQVTLKGTYLGTLDMGEKLFYAYLSTGGYSLIALQIK